MREREREGEVTDLIFLWGVTAAAVKTAAQIASKAPVAVRGTKIYLLHGRDHT